MKGNTQKMFLDFASNRQNGIEHIFAGLRTGDYHIGGNAMLNFTNASACVLACKEQCAPKAIEVVIAAPTDWDSYSEIGVKVMLVPNAEYDNETLLEFPSSFWYSYDTALGNPGTAKAVAAAIKTAVDNENSSGFVPKLWTAVYNESHADFAGGSGPSLIFVSEDCRYDIKVVAFGPDLASTTVYNEQADGLLNPHQVARIFPLPQLLPGEGVPSYAQRCKNPCVITISGCTPGCESNFEEPILTGGARTFTFQLWVDQDDADYPAFLTSLVSAVGTTCLSDNCLGIVAATLDTDLTIATTDFAANAKIKIVTKNIDTGFVNVGTEVSASTDENAASDIESFVILAAELAAMDNGEIIQITLSTQAANTCADRVINYVIGTGLLAS